MWHLLRNPPSLFGGWDSDRPRAVAAMFKGITGICDDRRHAIPGAGGNLPGQAIGLAVTRRRRRALPVATAPAPNPELPTVYG